MRSSILIIALCSLFIGSSFSSSPVIVHDWEKLGTLTVNYGLDKDKLHVGVREGSFTKLKIVVTHGKLNMHKMVVVYKNGQKEEINLRHNFNKRSDSRVIDLKGNKRIIKDIIFWYDTKNRSRKKAKVTVFGKH